MNLETLLLIVMWGLLAIILIIIELSTTNLITIWFAFGCIIALILGAFNIIWYFQIVGFLTTTITTLATGYPLLRRYLKFKPILKTNTDALINQQALMLNDYKGTSDENGLATLDGKVWTVTSDSDYQFKKNEKVLVKKIIGVKLLITEIKKGAN